MCLSGRDYATDITATDETTVAASQPLQTSRNEVFMKMFADVRRRLEKASKQGVVRYNLRKRAVEFTVASLEEKLCHL